jgi:hypothetical protein
MKRLLVLGLMLGLFALTVRTPAADDSDRKAAAKEALKELQDFIGGWKGNGKSDSPRPNPRDPIWSETASWSWRFKGDDAWLSLDVKDGKVIKAAEMRYLPEKKVYQLTVTGKDGKKQVYEGKLKNESLTFERTDPDSKATQRIQMNTAAEGVRFIYRIAHRDEGTTIWKKDYVVAFTKEGESLGKVDKKNECVVTGGLGTMPVQYKGETFYVCCSGCRDAFNENPEKYIAEFKAKKAGKNR